MPALVGGPSPCSPTSLDLGRIAGLAEGRQAGQQDAHCDCPLRHSPPTVLHLKVARGRGTRWVLPEGRGTIV